MGFKTDGKTTSVEVMWHDGEWNLVADFQRAPDADSYIQAVLLDNTDGMAFDVDAIKIGGILWSDYLEMHWRDRINA